MLCECALPRLHHFLDIAEKNASTSLAKNTRKRERNVSTSMDRLQNATLKQAVRVRDSKQDEKLKDRIDTKKAKRKRWSSKKLTDRTEGKQGEFSEF